MGKTKYNKAQELFTASPIVSMSSIQRIVNSKEYAKQLVRNLLLKGKIMRLAKGVYTAKENPSLAVYGLKPAYLGLQDALSYHNIWEQETMPVIITSRRIRPGPRTIMGQNVLIRRMNSKYLFGYEYEKQGDIYLPYSDIEKTFIDMIYFKEPLSKESQQNFTEKINKKKLNSYLENYPVKFRKKVFREIERIGLRMKSGVKKFNQKDAVDYIKRP